MSRSHFIHRRLSLLASLSAAAVVAPVLSPTVALAQTCTPATVVGSGPAADTVSCAAGTYAAGIAYNSEGDLTVNMVASGAVVNTTLTANGANLTGSGSNSVTWNSVIGTVTGGTGSAGPVIEALTGAGAITVNTATVTGTSSSVTYGIRAVSSGGGAVSVNSSGAVRATSSTGAGAVPGGSAAIAAISTGGNGNVSVTSTDTSNEAMSGRLIGLLAQASGTGTLTISHQGAVRAASSASAVAMDLTAGAGKLTVNSTGVGAMIGAPTNNSPFLGTAVRAVYGGAAEFNLRNVYATGSNWLVDLNAAGGGATLINVAGVIGTDSGGGALDRRTIRVIGGGTATLNLSGQLRGYVDFSAAGATNVSILSGGEWLAHGTSLFGGGADSLTLNNGGILQSRAANPGGDGVSGAVSLVVFDFGAGDDSLFNAGTFVVGGSNGSSGASGDWEFRLENLETFENAGRILMGASASSLVEGASDRNPNDILSLPGTTFIGSDGSVIALDVDLTKSQAACDNALRDPVTFELPAADCVRIENGATEGVTRIRVAEIVPGDRGAFRPEGVVLVDVEGGDSGAGHFVLDPGSSRYSSDHGGVIDKGFFIIPLVYDPDTQQHKLVALAGQNPRQYTLMAQAAHDLWRVSTGSWFERQADVRGDVPEGLGGAVWLRLSGESADRDAVQTAVSGASTFTFDNSFSQDSYAVTGGLDLLSGGGGDTAYVIGVMAGYANSEVAYSASPNTAQFDGWTGGGYASFISGGLFVDAAVNANKLILKNDVPALDLFPANTILDTNFISVGAQVEAGWRFGLTDSVFVEPLAGVTYVQSKYDDLIIAAQDPLRVPLTLEYDDPTSLRAGLGARLGLDQDYGAFRARFSMLGRYWNEFEDETRVVLHNPGDDVPLFDEFTGTFTEIGLGGSLSGMDGILSGFVNVGGKFGDGYEATNASAGVRFHW